MRGSDHCARLRFSKSKAYSSVNDVERPPDEDQDHRADDRIEDSRGMERLIARRRLESPPGKSGKQRPSDAKQGAGDKTHVHGAGIEEARQDTDDGANNEHDDYVHRCLPVRTEPPVRDSLGDNRYHENGRKADG